jgi:hypothetical protein
LGVILDHCKLDARTGRMTALDDLFSSNWSRLRTETDLLTTTISHITEKLTAQLK